ncbi:MAG: hypothetical protein ABI380_11940 [Edaphobacter sp.]
MQSSIVKAALAIALTATMVPMGWSQSTSQGMQTQASVLTSREIAKQGADQLAAAKKSPTGLSTVTLATYPGHHTMLIARSKSGVAEVHANYSDFLIVVDGGGTELTGGTVVNPEEQPDGETRGLRVDGATAHILHKGDVIHIPAGMPHQAIQAPGQTITLFVIKVQAAGTGDETAK